jgi:starch synthase
LGLESSSGPIFGIVTRLVHQKGIDLVVESAEPIVAAGGQIIVLGKGESHFERALATLAKGFPKSISVREPLINGSERA